MESATRTYWLAQRLVLICGMLCCHIATANSLVVYNNNDNGAGSLRQAIHDASAGDTITFSNTVTGTITLLSGELLIDKSVTITGPGPGALTVSGNGSSRVFNISTSTFSQAVTLSGLTIANGRAATNFGAAIFKDLPFGSLTLNQCIFSNNYAEFGGGAISSENGLLMITDSTFVSNVCFSPTEGSTGGAINNNNTAVALNCTFTGNSAAYGGAIVNEADSTFALTNCTLANNTARIQGGGIEEFGTQFSMRNTIVAGNNAPTSADCDGTFTSGGYNLIGAGTGSSGFVAVGDQVGSGVNPINPLLGPLQDNGGPTPTMAPQPASLAIDQGGSSGLSADQRGQPRPYDQPSVPNAVGGDGSDIGAVEAGSFLVVLNLNDHGTGSLRQAIVNAEQGAGSVITFSSGLTGTITLSSGELAITTNLSIFGPGAEIVTVNGNNAGRVFNITGTNVNISGLGLVGSGVVDACVRVFPGSGVSLGSCIVASNLCAGIYNEGTLTVINSTLAYNTNNTGFGGGIAHWDGATTVTNCTFSGNSARVGGGLYFDTSGSLSVDHCTIVSNFAVSGTIPSKFGGGMANFTSGTSTGHRIFIRDTIVAGNAAVATGPDLHGNCTSGGYNLIGQTNDSAGLTNGVNHDLAGSTAAPISALVGALQDNGGPTPTHALSPISPAVDAGNSFGLTTDQRGAPRPFDFATIANADDGSDIGAFELGSPQLSIQSGAANVVISWPAFYGGFTLQSVTNLPVTSGWSNVPGTPFVIANQFIVTNSTTGGGKFYRLQGN